jgi:hypothetical protein
MTIELIMTAIVSIKGIYRIIAAVKSMIAVTLVRASASTCKYAALIL